MNGNSIVVPNRCDRDGAVILQRKIRKYWGDWSIVFTTLDAGFHPSIRHSRIDLRSDMVNGLPRGLYLRLKGFT